MVAKLVVTITGIFLVVLVNWYFFFSKRKQTKSAVSVPKVQEVRITVKQGFVPDVVVVKRGVPVRLNIYRAETEGCSDIFVFEDFNIRKPLPVFKTTVIEFLPEEAGEFFFNCGTGMSRGKLIVR